MRYAIGFVTIIVLLMLLGAKYFGPRMPDWALSPCKSCGGIMKWLRGLESSTGEAKFACKSCGRKEHRGGSASEFSMEQWKSQT